MNKEKSNEEKNDSKELAKKIDEMQAIPAWIRYTDIWNNVFEPILEFLDLRGQEKEINCEKLSPINILGEQDIKLCDVDKDIKLCDVDKNIKLCD